MAGLSFNRKRRRQINYELIREVLVWTFQIAIVCLIAFVLVWYFGQRVSMVGDSMNPVMENGNVTLINRIVYDASTPKRGDVIAFKPNGNDSSYYYIKRIVGLPGETIEIRDGKIFIDEEELEEEYITTEIDDVGIVDEPMKLGNNEFFVLGDDRQNSEDSRTANIGNVKRSEIEGKVWFVVSPGDNFGFVK
ncbi:MAG: signal peptidase I [Tyzzerella sp.]|nr:signal peptidase I [Tyzzerella sp.]